MIRRIRRTLPWFGVVAALLLLALPVHADDIEPDPYAEEEAEPETAAEPDFYAEEEAEPETTAEAGPNIASKIFDVVPVRVFYGLRFVAGLPFFAFYPLTLASGFQEDVVALLWTEPFEATFLRPLGEPPGDYY
jgi:hypothetical protein